MNYKKQLYSAVINHFSQWDDNEWINLMSLINEDVLKDAHDQSDKFNKYLEGMQFQSRPAKSMNRIAKKSTELKQGKGFKVNSDLVAFRVFCHPVEIESIIQTIKQRVLEDSGFVHIRNEKRIDENGNPLDIVQYMFIYIPDIGYVCELQIGHPFAAYTFAIDSKIRDDPGCGLVDLWTNNFYSRVVKKILNPNYELDVRKEILTIFPSEPSNRLTDTMLEKEELMVILKSYIV